MAGPTPVPLRLYRSVAPQAPLPWDWVDLRLRVAGLYWVTARSIDHPHPRPVWGLWTGDRVVLSLGSPPLREALAADPRVTVHLPDAVDVVIVEGNAAVAPDTAALVPEYAAKYDYPYDTDQYGPFTEVRPSTVLAWRSAGEHGRDGFQQVGRWTFP